VTGGDELDDLD